MAKTAGKKRAAAAKRVAGKGAVAAKSVASKERGAATAGPSRKSAARAKGSAGRSGAVAKVRESAVPPMDPQELAHALNTLLHTMQHVQQFEESLCSMMHALRRGRATGALLRELRATLEQLPAHDYLYEVDALRDAMAA